MTQQNAGLGSMNTGEVLDLFKVSADGDKGKTSASTSSGGSMAKVLEGCVGRGSADSSLEDLPPEDEYADLSMDNFLSKNG